MTTTTGEPDTAIARYPRKGFSEARWWLIASRRRGRTEVLAPSLAEAGAEENPPEGVVCAVRGLPEERGSVVAWRCGPRDGPRAPAEAVPADGISREPARRPERKDGHDLEKGRGRVLPVFGSEEDALLFLGAQALSGRWRAVEVGAEELVSALLGPACAGAVEKVALDPMPEVTAVAAAALVGVDREAFARLLLSRTGTEKGGADHAPHREIGGSGERLRPAGRQPFRGDAVAGERERDAFRRPVPVRDDYATLPIWEGFDRSGCAAGLGPNGLYLVVFRSVRRESADLEVLRRYDDRAHEEARGSPGFVHYFKGQATEERQCPSFCLWTSEEDARATVRRPCHSAAVGIADEMYESFGLERYRVRRHADASGRSAAPVFERLPDTGARTWDPNAVGPGEGRAGCTSG